MMDTDKQKLELWQHREINAGIAELDAGHELSHDEVSRWLKSWGKPSEVNPPHVYPNATTPKVPCDPRFRHILVGLSKPLVFRFKAPTKGTFRAAFGLIENCWDAPEKRVLELRVEGKGIRTVDLAKEFGKNVPAVLCFDAKDADGDGIIELSVHAVKPNQDPNPTVSFLALFDAQNAPGPERILAGGIDKEAIAFLHADRSERPATLSPDQIAERQKEIMEEQLSRKAVLEVRLYFLRFYEETTEPKTKRAVLQFGVFNSGTRSPPDGLYWRILIPKALLKTSSIKWDEAETEMSEAADPFGEHCLCFENHLKEPVFPKRTTFIGSLDIVVESLNIAHMLIWSIVAEDGAFPSDDRDGELPLTSASVEEMWLRSLPKDHRVSLGRTDVV
jgi:hypothetical protein